MSKVFLVRHGLVDYNTLKLSHEGQSFAQRLPELIEDNIDFIATDGEDRCRTTIAALAQKRDLQPVSYDKSQFASGAVWRDALAHETSVICYRVESLQSALSGMGLKFQTLFTDRDSTYENIIWYSSDAGTYGRIDTGQKPDRSRQ